MEELGIKLKNARGCSSDKGMIKQLCAVISDNQESTKCNRTSIRGYQRNGNNGHCVANDDAPDDSLLMCINSQDIKRLSLVQ